ncbi:MAG: thioredoxin-disulfide reductase [Candidatus Manganitrophus sp.]|nr:thioredoxin-disulfide reductase [Candidatus Manganitrophus sp.]MDC4226828.1 thioredoxin-disulfide reductase [Candidatus Manganitrophus sp.]WDT72045.1 MAG: thioredoxin-disulfide reductase [Candidatus Manganitrophus sp.]WDT80550.1 MAG: thioredoxin-disulfide reductase [Candidatus Manganitrophus sp.]
MTEKIENVIIIGSGPAGLTAAIYAARANLHPVLIEGAQAGGQLMITTDVENFPGFPDGIQGPQLILEMKKQAQRFDTTFITGDVTSVDFSQRPFSIVVDGERTYRTRSVIICSGARAKLLGIESEARLMGHGVSACATCDGFFFRGKDVFIVGGGDTAMEEATFLTRFANQVTVIHRRDKLRASKIMQDKAFKNPKIKFVWDTTISDILDGPSGTVSAAVLQNLKTGETSQLKIDGVFIAIGHEPNTALFKGQLALDDRGYIKTQPGTPRTNVPGVFAAGDVQDPNYRQAITAAGTGCMAAMDAEKFLESEEGH